MRKKNIILLFAAALALVCAGFAAARTLSSFGRQEAPASSRPGEYVSGIDIPQQEHGVPESSEKLDVSAEENDRGETVFAFTLDDFVASYNSLYPGGEYELPYSYMWEPYPQDSSIHSDQPAVFYQYSADSSIWSYPTISAYTPSGSDRVLEIFLSFDDHGYTDYLHEIYGGLCLRTLKTFFPDLEDGKLTELSAELERLAYEYYPEEHGFSFGAVPSELFYRGSVGLYPYFADGGTVKLCIIPVTEQILKDFGAGGTKISEIT